MLEKYKSHKIVHAEPMTDWGFNNRSVGNGGSFTPASVSSVRVTEPQDGYHVVYSKGLADEYHSWSPAKAFEEGYMKMLDENVRSETSSKPSTVIKTFMSELDAVITGCTYTNYEVVLDATYWVLFRHAYNLREVTGHFSRNVKTGVFRYRGVVITPSADPNACAISAQEEISTKPADSVDDVPKQTLTQIVKASIDAAITDGYIIYELEIWVSHTAHRLINHAGLFAPYNCGRMVYLSSAEQTQDLTLRTHSGVVIAEHFIPDDILRAGFDLPNPLTLSDGAGSKSGDASDLIAPSEHRMDAINYMMAGATGDEVSVFDEARHDLAVTGNAVVHVSDEGVERVAPADYPIDTPAVTAKREELTQRDAETARADRLETFKGYVDTSTFVDEYLDEHRDPNTLGRMNKNDMHDVGVILAEIAQKLIDG